MANFIDGFSPQHHLGAGEQLKRYFNPTNHAVVAAEMKAYLGLYAKYAAKQKAVDSAEAKEAKAREALGEADTVRDDAVLSLDLALINDGASKQNSFKQFGAPAPSAFVTLAVEKESAAVKALVAKVMKSKSASKPVLAAAKALAAANARVAPKEAALKAAVAGSTNARIDRNAIDRPLRRALSVLKLRTRAAETEGASGLYAELFATEAAPKPQKEEPLPDAAPTPPAL